MAGQGALYQGLQYANKGVTPADFSVIGEAAVKGFMQKQAKDEAERKENEQFSLKMIELYGQDISTPFIKTGLNNVDAVNQQVSEIFNAQAETANALFNEGKISKTQLASRLNNLRSQTLGYAQFLNGLKDFKGKYDELGDNASFATRQNIDKISEMFNGLSVTADSEGTLSFYSKLSGKEVQTPFNSLGDLITPQAGFNENEFLGDIVKAKGELSDYRTSQGLEYSFLNKDGSLQDSDKVRIKGEYETMSDKEIADIADKLGLEPKLVNGKLEDREAYKTQVIGYFEESLKSMLGQKGRVSEKDGALLNNTLQKNWLAQQKLKADKGESLRYNSTVIGDKIQYLPKPTVSATLPAQPQILRNKIDEGELGIDLIDFVNNGKVNVLQYEETNNGDFVTLSFTKTVPGDKLDATTKTGIERRIAVKGFEEANVYRNALGMPLISISKEQIQKQKEAEQQSMAWSVFNKQ